MYLSCAGCRGVNAAKANRNAPKKMVRTAKYNFTTSKWIDSVDNYQHICEPKKYSEVMKGWMALGT